MNDNVNDQWWMATIGRTDSFALAESRSTDTINHDAISSSSGARFACDIR